MAHIEITDDKLIVHVTGIDVLLSFKSKLELPLSHVVDATTHVSDEAKAQLDESIRLPGAYMPGIAIAGSFYAKGQWMFWDIHSGKNAITLSVEHEKWNRIVVEVDDPEATVAAIKAKLGKS